MISFTIVLLVLASTLHKVGATSEPNFSASSTCAKDKEKCRSKVPCCPGLTCKGDWNTGKKCTRSTPGPTYRPCPGVNEKCRQGRCCKGLVCKGKWPEAKCVNPYPTPGPTYKPKKCAKKGGNCSKKTCCGDLECGNGNKCKEATKNPPPVAQPSPKPPTQTKSCLKMNISCDSKKDKCCDWLTCSQGKCVLKQKCAKKGGDCSKKTCCGDLECGNGNKCKEATKNPPPVAQPSPKPPKPTKPCLKMNISCDSKKDKCCNGLTCSKGKCVKKQPDKSKCIKSNKSCESKKDECCDWLTCSKGKCVMKQPDNSKCIKSNESCESKKDKCCVGYICCNKSKCGVGYIHQGICEERKIDKDERCGKNKIGKCRDGFQCCNKYKCGYDIWGKCTDKQ